MAVAIVGLGRAEGAPVIGGSLLVLSTGVTAWAPLHIAIHETGHAVVATMVGFRVTRIQIGMGPDLFRFRLGDTQVQIGRDLLGGGKVRNYGRPGADRWRRTLIYLGGLLANLVSAVLVAGLLICLDPFDLGPVGTSFGVAAAAFVFAEIVRTPYCLFPKMCKIGGEALPSDGLAIFRLWRRTSDPGAEALAYEALECIRHQNAGRWPEARARFEAARRRYPDQGYFAGGLVHVIGRHEGAQAVVDWYLEQKDGLEAQASRDPQSWASVFGNAAWQMLRLRRSDLLPLALDLSERALVSAPSFPAFRATRGAALMTNGDADGRAMLTAALPEIDDPVDRAEFIAFLGVQAALAGDAPGAAALRGLEAHLLKAA